MSNDERSVALAIENEILLAVVEINKWQHIIQDRRLALQRITHEAEGQAIGIQQSRNFWKEFCLESVGYKMD